MATTLKSPPPATLTPGQSKRLSLADITRAGRNLPSRIVLHGVQGVGKTSMFAYAPRPVFIQTRGETGLETLIDAGQLPEIDHLPEVENWDDLRGVVNELQSAQHDYKTLVLDVVNGAERLCHEHVCRTQYEGDWGEKGFTGYMRGYGVALTPWREFLNDLDRLRETKRMAIVLLAHTKVATFKNPEGADYDRYEPELHPKTWALTHAWADLVLFYTYDTAVLAAKGKGADELKKGKARGGTQRVLYTQRSAAWDAKNRHGLPVDIDAGDSGESAWQNFLSAMKTAKQAKGESQ